MAARSKNHDWLAQTVETALEPDLPICDPHHHLWDFRKGTVQGRYLLEEILQECIARRCFRVLIEERLEGPRLGTLDVFAIASGGSSPAIRMLQATTGRVSSYQPEHQNRS